MTKSNSRTASSQSETEIDHTQRAKINAWLATQEIKSRIETSHEGAWKQAVNSGELTAIIEKYIVATLDEEDAADHAFNFPDSNT